MYTEVWENNLLQITEKFIFNGLQCNINNITTYKIEFSKTNNMRNNKNRCLKLNAFKFLFRSREMKM